ncbi:hypothetical protein [Cohnella sp. GCM10027633]|uniref:hypothetical protein n=1 Tax=unclassified Cohnella TaxID=2636738 RepID=UPI00362A636E
MYKVKNEVYIKYLKSRLEIAEKALEEVMVFEKQYNDCINRSVMPDHESFISAMGGSASLALQQIRS